MATGLDFQNSASLQSLAGSTKRIAEVFEKALAEDRCSDQISQILMIWDSWKQDHDFQTENGDGGSTLEEMERVLNQIGEVLYRNPAEGV